MGTWATLDGGPDRHVPTDNHDLPAARWAGLTSLGDIDLSPDAALLFVVNLFDRRIYALAADSGDPSARIAASRSKLFGSEMVGRVADRVVQIFGGAGYVADLPVERMYRDARAFRIGEGTSEMQRIQIARHLLGR